MSDEEDYSEGSDEDYVPSEGEAVSEEELSGDEEDIELLKKEGGEDVKASGKRKRQKKNSIVQRKRKGGIKLDGEEEKDKIETEEEIKARKELEERIKEKQKIKKEEQEKKRADDLWSSFMSDVGHKPKPKPSPSVTPTATARTTSVTTQVKPSDSTTSSKKITITKEYDFAGETVKVTKEVDENSKEAKEVKKQETVCGTPSPGLSAIGIKRPVGGLGSVLDKINKKQKISTLGKSKLDWDKFKKDYKLEDDLKSHNKGKEGYLERVAFLNRTEQREFEKERDLRLSQSSKR